MQFVDAKWIKDRLTGRRGEKADLAKAVGITAKQLSYILGGTRRVQQEEVAAFQKFFDETPETQQIFGMAEPKATFIESPHGTRAEQLLKLAAQTNRHAQLYRIENGDTGQGLKAGDIAIVDLKGTPKAGDLVVCTLTDIQTGISQTRVRTWFDPWLIGADTHDLIDPASGNAAILGLVIGSVRGIEI